MGGPKIHVPSPSKRADLTTRLEQLRYQIIYRFGFGYKNSTTKINLCSLKFLQKSSKNPL